MRKQKCTYPNETPSLRLFEAIEEMEQQTYLDPDLCGFILDYEAETPKVLAHFKMDRMGFKDRFTFEDYKDLHISPFFKILDEVYSQEGLKMVQEGKKGLLDSSYNVRQISRIIPYSENTKDYYLFDRQTFVRKIINGSKKFDGMLLYYKKQEKYFGTPQTFLPVFLTEDGIRLKKYTDNLRFIACFKVLQHPAFPLEELQLDICEYILDGRSNQKIAEALGIKLRKVYDMKKHIVKKLNEFIDPFPPLGIQALVAFLRACRLI